MAWTADHRGSTPPKSFFESLPRELEEAAQIDGLGWFGIFVRIVLPLSKAVLATMILFYAVSYWNDWFTAFLYLDNNNLFALSLFLRNLIAGASTTHRRERRCRRHDLCHHLPQHPGRDDDPGDHPDPVHLPVRAAALRVGSDARLRQGVTVGADSRAAVRRWPSCAQSRPPLGATSTGSLKGVVVEVLKDYVLGDTIARYMQPAPGGPVGMMLFPAAMAGQVAEKSSAIDSLVQIKTVGDTYPGGSAGRSLRNGGTVATLTLESQLEDRTDAGVTVVTLLRTHQGCLVEHHLRWQSGEAALDSFAVLRNEGPDTVTLELLSSFSLTGLTPFAGDDAPGDLILHRLRSAWSGEGRLVSDHVEDLSLEPAWASWERCLRFGQVGSWPVQGFFPTAFVEDSRAGVCWGVQIAHPASWQIELGRTDAALNLSGGLADRELGHWTKSVAPGEEFRTPVAYLTVTQGGVDDAAHRLTARHQLFLDVPAVEEALPIIFNEYCTTWGSPSPQNLGAIVDRLAGKGIRYLVIDSGWYKAEGSEWFNGHGDWELDRRTFPDGLTEALDHVRSAGMIPGIWFEFETVGSRATSFTLTDHLLKRDGVPVTVGDRRFWDFRDPFVIGYLKERMIDFLKANGFGYLKVDYNNSIGIGCDGAESLGEGLRQQMAAVQGFFRMIREEMPELVIENCASGGHRLEPSMLALTSMSSFSDAHECAEIPIIAANVQRALLPRQSQIWAVLRAQDSPQRLAYSLTATMLGRMCLSGDIHELSDEQWAVVSRAITFYRAAVPVIKNGVSHRFGPKVSSYRHPEGWQAVRRVSNDGAQILVVAHRFGAAERTPIEVALPPGRYEVSDLYSHREIVVKLTEELVAVELNEPFSAAALLLTQIE